MNGSEGKLSVFNRKGCPIHYWLAGQPNRPLIAFTHGGILDHRMFHAQVNMLAPEYRIFTWDVRGHGKSQPIAEAAEDLISIIDELGYKEAILVGHSMGGVITQEFYFRYPERVRALVTIGSTCITLKFSAWESAVRKLLPLMHRVCPALNRLVVQACAVKKEVRTYCKEAMSRVDKEDFIAILTGLSLCLHYEPQYTINCPILLTAGECDYMVSKKHALVWAARDTRCQYTVIPNVRHNAHQDNPEFFNSVLNDFLNSLPCQ